MSVKFRDEKKFSGSTVEVKHDDFNRALKNWSKKVEESGLLKDLKERMSYEPPSVEKQRLKKQSRKRWERKVEEMIDKGLWDKNKPY